MTPGQNYSAPGCLKDLSSPLHRDSSLCWVLLVIPWCNRRSTMEKHWKGKARWEENPERESFNVMSQGVPVKTVSSWWVLLTAIWNRFVLLKLSMNKSCCFFWLFQPLRKKFFWGALHLDDPRPAPICPWLSKGFVIPTPQRFLFVLSALSHPMMQQKIHHGEALKRESQMKGKSGKGKFQCDVPRSSCQNCQ